MADSRVYISLFLLFIFSASTFGQNIPNLVGSKLPNIAGKDLSKNKYALKVKDCFEKDKANLDNCLLQFWKDIVPLIKTGDPELNLPPLDPLVIDLIEFSENSPTVKVNATFSNIKVVGAAGLIPKTLKKDVKAKTVTLTLTFPFLNMSGDYTLKGSVMVLNVDGSGKYVTNLSGVDATVVSHFEHKGTGVRVAKLSVDFTIKDIFIKMDGLLGGDEVGTAVNTMLNDQSQHILGDIKPVIRSRLETIFLNMTGNAFIDLPADAFGA